MDERGTKRVALYLRVSLDDGRQTVENQRDQLADFCEAMGWEGCLLRAFGD